MFSDLRSRLARTYEHVIASRTRIALAAVLAVLSVAACKYALVGLMLHEGASRTQLRVQDALTAGVLAGIAIWIALAVAHVRRGEIGEQVQTVADLNHHLRNALSIILNSRYLREHEQKDAILESVDRIDRALQRIVPAPPATPKDKTQKFPMRSASEQVEVRGTDDSAVG